MSRLLVFSFVFLTLSQVDGYTWGLARTACNFFTPSHLGRNRRPPDDYYQLSSDKVIFSPGETIEIRVVGPSPQDKYVYTGILMSVRKDGESFGTWEESYDFHHVDCSNKLGSAIAESNQFPKLLGADVFRWTAPDECNMSEMYYVSATVVKTKREFLDGLSLPLKCVQASNDRHNDSCSRQYSAIPQGAITSFEASNPGGWTIDLREKLLWSSKKGSTPSPGTGPSEAFDGEYYMYMESSFPARKGHRAVLISPPGLAGCLCFRFAYHMYTDAETKFYCTVNDKTVECQHPNFHSERMSRIAMDSRRDRWIQSWISINEPTTFQIKFIGQRGATFRGDIALDNFTFTPGQCVEDQEA